MIERYETRPGNLLEALRTRALAARAGGGLSPEATRIRGVWRTSYVIELAPKSSRLHLHYVIVQTATQGCSYYEPTLEAPGLSEGLIGCDVLKEPLGDACWEIAALDAVFGDIARPPTVRHRLSGLNVAKASERARIACDEVVRVLALRRAKGARARVVNVGVVGDMLFRLQELDDIEVSASDYYQGIVGREIAGTLIEHGSRTGELVAQADVALVTGMTLANGTLADILAIARENDTGLVLFAQTGAHFAEAYCEWGIDTVLSEPPPFYLSGTGESVVDVYRRAPLPT